VNNSNIALTMGGREALEARLARRMAARLNERAEQLSPDLAERLRFARERAIERSREARAAAAQPHVTLVSGGSAILGRASGWWVRLGSALPLLVLAAGLMLIQHWHTEAQIATAAEIDADLLADDLPPSAYSDAGFVEFLKTPRE
jgi:type II secretory pathway component PulL